jgi:hypothetical protein
VLAKKQAMFLELTLAVEQLVQANDQHVRNEASRMQVQAQIDTNLVELQQLKFVVQELEGQLITKKGLYKQLKRDITELD